MSDIHHVAVIGLGTMGHGIAQRFAMAGCRVTVYDEASAARASLRERIRRNLDTFVEAGLIGGDEAEPTLARIEVCASEAAAVGGAGCVTEAIVEDLPAKQAFLARIEPLLSETAILASNSSTFPISASGARLTHPERALVTHWFNPPHIVPCVEVVGSPKTSEGTILATINLLRKAGKRPIRLTQELPGFLVNRIQAALVREVWDLYARGVASAEDIDAAVQGSMGLRLATMGPLRVSDFAGLDIWATVYENLAPDLASGTTAPQAVRALVDAGHLGFKTGEGFHTYEPESADAIRAERDRRFLQVLKLLDQ
jgi:3-hydroxybutyryl-CoA dehydrogenase